MSLNRSINDRNSFNRHGSTIRMAILLTPERPTCDQKIGEFQLHIDEIIIQTQDGMCRPNHRSDLGKFSAAILYMIYDQ